MSLSGKLPSCFPEWLHYFISLLKCISDPFFLYPLQVLVLSLFLILAIWINV